jgi:hypothetical protein
VVEGAARRIFREAGAVDMAGDELPAPVAAEAVSSEALL